MKIVFCFNWLITNISCCKMMASRSLCLSAIRMSQPAIYSRVATVPLKRRSSIIWYTKPLSVAYSKDAKPGGKFYTYILNYRSYYCSLVSFHYGITNFSFVLIFIFIYVILSYAKLSFFNFFQ